MILIYPEINGIRMGASVPILLSDFERLKNKGRYKSWIVDNGQNPMPFKWVLPAKENITAKEIDAKLSEIGIVCPDKACKDTRYETLKSNLFKFNQ
jgi:hypothetical protein